MLSALPVVSADTWQISSRQLTDGREIVSAIVTHEAGFEFAVELAGQGAAHCTLTIPESGVTVLDPRSAPYLQVDGNRPYVPAKAN